MCRKHETREHQMIDFNEDIRSIKNGKHQKSKKKKKSPKQIK